MDDELAEFLLFFHELVDGLGNLVKPFMFYCNVGAGGGGGMVGMGVPWSCPWISVSSPSPRTVFLGKSFPVPCSISWMWAAKVALVAVCLVERMSLFWRSSTACCC